MRKPRRNLSPDERSLLMHLIEQHMRTGTRELMALFGVTRNTIERYRHRCKLHVSRAQQTNAKIQP